MAFDQFVTGTDLRMLAPMIVVAVTGIVVLLLGVMHRTRASKSYLAWVSIIGLAAAGLDSFYLMARGADHVAMGGMLYVDSFGLAINLLIVVAGVLGCLISPAFLESHRLARGEYYGLLLFSAFGMMVMGSSADLFAMFMGLEMMSMSPSVTSACAPGDPCQGCSG